MNKAIYITIHATDDKFNNEFNNKSTMSTVKTLEISKHVQNGVDENNGITKH